MKFLRIFGVAAQRPVELFWQSNKQPWLQIDNALKITLRCNKHPSKRKIQEPYFGSWNILHPVSSAAEAPFFVPLALNAILLGYPAGPLREPVPGSQIVGKTRKSPQFPPALFSCSRFLNPHGPDYLGAWNRLPLRIRESCTSKSGERKGATWPS